MAHVERQRPVAPAGVIVRNAYPDLDGSWGEVERAAAEYGWAVLDPGRNTGFAGGANLGLARAAELGAEFVWLINPDARAADDALAVMVAAMKRDGRLAAVGCRLGSGPPGGRVVWWSGRAVERERPPWGFVSGASVLLRRSAVAEVGGFDERLFLYWEDVDLCVRLRRAGYRLAVADDAHVFHEGGRAVGRGRPVQDYFSARNGLLVVRQHAARFLPTAAACTAVRITLAKLVRGDWARLRAAWRGWWDGLRGAGGPGPGGLTDAR